MYRDPRVYYEIRPTNFSVKINEIDISGFTHMHEDIEILYMREGTQRILMDEKEYTVDTGDAIVIFPNCVHQYCRGEKPKPADEVLIISSFKFYGKFLADLKDFIPENPIIKKENISEDVKYAFSAIDKTENEKVIAAWLVIIMSNIIGGLKLTRKKVFRLKK